MQLRNGSGRPGGTDGVILIRGRKQITLEWGAFTAELLLTMDLYGVGGSHIARLRRNHWTFNDHERFAFTSSDRRFSLMDVKTNQVVLAGRVVGRDAVAITQGVFYSADGHEIDITKENWNGVEHSGSSPASSAQATIPPFARDEIARIRESVATSSETIPCPRCRRPLTTQPFTRLDSLLVTCTVCKGSLVVRGPT